MGQSPGTAVPSFQMRTVAISGSWAFLICAEKVAKIRVFAFLEVEKRVPPIFAKSRKTCTPYFYEKFHKNRYLIFFM